MNPDMIRTRKIPNFKEDLKRINYEPFQIKWYNLKYGYGFAFRLSKTSEDLFFHVKEGRIPTFNDNTNEVELIPFPKTSRKEVVISVPNKTPQSGDMIFGIATEDCKHKKEAIISWFYQTDLTSLQAKIAAGVEEWNKRVEALPVFYLLLERTILGEIYADNAKKQLMQKQRVEKIALFEGNNFQNLEETVKMTFRNMNHSLERLCFLIKRGQKWEEIECPFPEYRNFLQKAMTCIPA